jgi:hypothetical protein
LLCNHFRRLLIDGQEVMRIRGKVGRIVSHERIGSWGSKCREGVCMN